MTPQPLEDQAAEFAERMTRLLRETIADDAEITSAKITSEEDGREHFFLRNGEIGNRPLANLKGQPIRVAGSDALSLSVAWTFEPNTEGLYLKTMYSVFALNVTTAGKPAPFIRLEVDEKRATDDWAKAHIHVTADSALLGHIHGSQGLPFKTVQKLHLPVGGFRYRPCLEDFIEFLAHEQLCPVKDGWPRVVDESRAEYRQSQFKSMVRKEQALAVEVLAERGYRIDPPPT